jgi:chitinase
MNGRKVVRPHSLCLVLSLGLFGVAASAEVAHAQIVIDNGSSGFSTGGSWAASTGVAGYYGTTFLHDNGAGVDTGDWAKWKPTFPSTGSYKVEVRWTAHSNRADNVKYKIYHQGVVTEVRRNQQQNNATWMDLGTYTFSAGNSESNRLTLDAGSDSGYVVADAARFTSAGGNPTPTPCGSCGGTGNKLVGYWHNFDNGSGNIKLREVSSNWDWIQVAFAEPTSPTSGDMRFAPYNATVDEFKGDIALLKSRGKRVLISIGGANGQVQLSSTAARDRFVSTMTSLIQTYGFSGFDIDFEGSSLRLNAGDRSISAPTTPVIVNTIAAIRSIQSNTGGMVTFAPETFFVQLGHSFYGGTCSGCDTRAGAYLPLLYDAVTRGYLSMLHVQHYNSGAITGLDGQYHTMGNADFHVAMGDMVLAGFSVAGTGQTFPPIPSSKVGIGLPANVNAGGGYTSEAEVQRAVGYLAGRNGPPSSYTKRSGNATEISIMSWSINWDRFNNFIFSNSHRQFLNGL